MKRPELGSWHTITERAEKQRDGNKVAWVKRAVANYDNRIGRWLYRGNENPAPPNSGWGSGWVWERGIITERHAMYIGYRYKFNGHNVIAEMWDEENVIYGFIQEESVEVWMFVTHENRNPIPVFPFEIEQK